MKWPTTEVELWHPDSPGVRVTVQRRWPRPVPKPDWSPERTFPGGFATNAEVLRMYDAQGVGRRPARYRALCWLLGHRMVRHITSVELPHQGLAILEGLSTWSQAVTPTDWYYRCSRCRLHRDRANEGSPHEHLPVWKRLWYRVAP